MGGARHESPQQGHCSWKRSGRLGDRLRRLWATELFRLPVGGGRSFGYRARYLRNSMLVGLALFLLSEADPFGIDDATERYSAEIFQRLIARSYDREPASDLIRVVLVTDAYAPEHGDWPMPFSEHAVLLSTMLAFQPAVVFVDLGFLDERNDSSLEELREVARDYRARGTSLYFVRGRAAPSRPSGIVEPLAGEVTLVSGAFWPDRYELFDCRLGVQSAALALASDWWRRDGRAQTLPRYLTSAGCPEKKTLRRALAWPFRPSECAGNLPGGDPRLCMDIVWSDWEGNENGRNGAQECLDRFGSSLWLAFDPLFAFLHDLGLGFIRPFGGQTCGPHRSLTAVDLAASERTALTDPDPDKRSRERAELDGFFRDKIVIYGGHIEMADDLFQPPTHRPLPGAYYHAMALDNLLRFGAAGYKVQQPQIGGRSVGWLSDLAAFCIATFLTGLFARVALDGGDPGPVPPARYRAELRAYLLRSAACSAIGLAFLLAFLAGLIGLEFYVLDWGPANFVGLIGLQFAWWGSYLRSWWERRPHRAVHPCLYPDY